MGRITPIPFTGQAYEGRSLNLNTQECVNYYHVIDKSGGKSVLSLMGRPGLSLFADLGSLPIRGVLPVAVDGLSYWVQGPNLYRMRNDGTGDIVGTLNTSVGQVGLAWNGVHIMIVDGLHGYTYNPTTSTFAEIADADFLLGDDVTFIDSFFVTNIPGTGRVQSSAIRNGTSWNALDIATAEGDPDNLIKPIAIHNDLWLMGDTTSEIWYYASLATGFPFLPRQRENQGLAARWGAVIADNTLFWPAKNREGFFGIVMATGGVPVKISPPTLDYAMSSYSTVADCIGWSFTLEGHTFVGFTFPAGNATWVFDTSTRLWAEWRSKTIGRFRAAFPVFVGDKHLMGDTTTGKLYEIKFGQYDDDDDFISRIRTTQHLSANGRPVTINRLWVEFESGVGLTTGQGSNPMACLEISRDGGHTWGNEMWRPLGKLGDYGCRALWDRLGMARVWTFRVTVTDPVKTVMLGAYADISAGGTL